MTKQVILKKDVRLMPVDWSIYFGWPLA